jgi:hypothetical protein
MISRILCFALFSVALMLLACVGNPASAQMRGEPSNAEDIAIAFFKTAGTNPDFDKWAKGGKDYMTTAPARVPDFLYKEKQRLIQLWQKYDGTDPIIDIKADILVTLKTTADEDKNLFYWMYISFGKDDAVYFPYTYQDYKIAVIPQLIETLMIQQLQKEQYEMMLHEFGEKQEGSAVMYLQLKPVKAYIHQPYKIDGEEQWALLSDIATLSVKSYKTGSPFWNYSADWYMSPVTEELRDLYQAPAGSAPSN